MHRMLDYALTAATAVVVAYAGAVVPPPLAIKTPILAQAGKPGARVAPRPQIDEANRTGPTIDDVLVQSCLMTGASPAPFYLCAPGGKTLHMSRSPIRERTLYPVVTPLIILPQN